MTLTDFLLARIAEDAAEAHEALRPDESGDTRTYYTTPGPHRDDWGLWTFHVDPVRVLAECETKRRIVGYVEAHVAEADTGRSEMFGVGVLELLALPYADHPDYLEEWRP